MPHLPSAGLAGHPRVTWSWKPLVEPDQSGGNIAARVLDTGAKIRVPAVSNSFSESATSAGSAAPT